MLFVAALIPLVAGPDDPSPDAAERLADDDVRRDGPRHHLQRAGQPARPRERPDVPVSAIKALVIPLALLVLATELGLQRGLLTQSLTGREWLACFGLAALLPLVVETDKWLRRRHLPAAADPEVWATVAPARALAGSAT